MIKKIKKLKIFKINKFKILRVIFNIPSFEILIIFKKLQVKFLILKLQLHQDFL
jgi:hypothetical protein